MVPTMKKIHPVIIEEWMCKDRPDPFLHVYSPISLLWNGGIIKTPPLPSKNFGSGQYTISQHTCINICISGSRGSSHWCCCLFELGCGNIWPIVFVKRESVITCQRSAGLPCYCPPYWRQYGRCSEKTGGAFGEMVIQGRWNSRSNEGKVCADFVLNFILVYMNEVK